MRPGQHLLCISQTRHHGQDVILNVTEVERDFQGRGPEILTVAGETANNVGFIAQDLVDASDFFAMLEDTLESQPDIVGLCDGHTIFHHLYAGLDTVDQGCESVHNIITEPSAKSAYQEWNQSRT